VHLTPSLELVMKAGWSGASVEIQQRNVRLRTLPWQERHCACRLQEEAAQLLFTSEAEVNESAADVKDALNADLENADGTFSDNTVQ
jgi:hypothetical protein